eukprot:TRINITY_DN2672_c3_g2_i5.p1 TRINITY_DN2672_c3_g2~~TRINITY_DN2672_c3_g2_i5.p1  ORF type:complete len:375 (+),score=154.82 TRINITY_DN2672_c3_g2_i5:99-1223(+)
MGARTFVGTYVKGVLCFLVVCASLASVVACVMLIEANVKAEPETPPPAHQHPHGTTADAGDSGTWQKATAVLTYTFWIAISLILGVVEFEPMWVFNYLLYLHYWFGRGTMQFFMGLQLAHSSTVMPSNTVVFGMDASKAQFLVQSLGWCYIATGTAYILLSMLCLRRSTKVVDILRNGGKPSNLEEGGGGVALIPDDPHAQLDALKQLRNQGVASLDAAVILVESQIAAQEKEKKKKKGWFGWGKKEVKGGKNESASLVKEGKKGGGAYGTAAGAGAGSGEIQDMHSSVRSSPQSSHMEHSVRGIVDVRSQMEQSQHGQSQGSISLEGTSRYSGAASHRSPRSSPRSPPVAADDIARRRQLEDDELERAYYQGK